MDKKTILCLTTWKIKDTGNTQKILFNPTFFIVGAFAVWTGLEPATPAVTGQYSNQLNYHTVLVLRSAKIKEFI
jgi:hypothetical protein